MSEGRINTAQWPQETKKSTSQIFLFSGPRAQTCPVPPTSLLMKSLLSDFSLSLTHEPSITISLPLSSWGEEWESGFGGHLEPSPGQPTPVPSPTFPSRALVSSVRWAWPSPHHQTQLWAAQWSSTSWFSGSNPQRWLQLNPAGHLQVKLDVSQMNFIVQIYSTT